jgi:hypothetical protein
LRSAYKKREKIDRTPGTDVAKTGKSEKGDVERVKGQGDFLKKMGVLFSQR